MLDEDQPRYQTYKVCGAKDCDCTERDLRAFQAGAASRDAEVARLKTVPMKYRRMEFNAQLQKENDQLREQVALLRHASSDLLARTGINGKYAVELIEALAATEPKK